MRFGHLLGGLGVTVERQRKKGAGRKASQLRACADSFSGFLFINNIYNLLKRY